MTPPDKSLPNSLRVQFPQSIPEQAARVTSTRTSREVAGAVQREHVMRIVVFNSHAVNV
jgi:hypothetical protein